MMARSSRREPASLLLSQRALRLRRFSSLAIRSFLFAIASTSVLIVLFIFYYILKEAFPFFRMGSVGEFFTSTKWYPTSSPPSYGALAIFFGSGIVTLGAVLVAVPVGLAAAVCLSDILPFSVRQIVKPIIEILAAIPSVAFGFLALVVFAPILQNHGGTILSTGVWLAGAPVSALMVVLLSHRVASKVTVKYVSSVRWIFFCVLGFLAAWILITLAGKASNLEISSGTNALNVSIILGIMAIPTVVSVAEDSLQAAGRELREGCYALGATRAETMLRVILPAASAGISAAVVLGVMRAIGETMVVWMASGNAAQIPSPWYNLLEPVRTLTATIAGEMGEADQVTGSARYHVLFVMASCLLAISFLCVSFSQWVVKRSPGKGGQS